MQLKTIVWGLGGLFLLSQCGQLTATTKTSFQEHEVKQNLNEARDGLRDESRKAEQDSRAWLEVIETQGCVPVVDAKTMKEAPFLVGEKVTISPNDVRPLPSGTVICNSSGAVGRLGNFGGDVIIESRGQIVAKHMGDFLSVFNAIQSKDFEALE